MRVNLIVAVCKNNGIGMAGSLPWYIKEDMKHFYNTTIGNGNNAVVMGRKTWDSLKGKPLKNRFNFILTRNTSEIQHINSLNYNNVLAFSSINNMLNYCNSNTFDELWVIGGSQIYNEFLNMRNICDKDSICDMCVITYIDKVFECDTFLERKEIDNKWHMTNQKEINEYTVIQYWKRII